MKRGLWVLAALAWATPSAAASWREWTTPHHRIYAPVALAEFALAVSRAAERLATPIADRYGFVPAARTTWVLHDDAEWFNGAAYSGLNHIELYNTTAEFDNRGYTLWVENVVAHEFAHLATLERARRMPRWIGGLVFGSLEEWSPGRVLSVAGGAYWYLPAERVPRWFSEGIAQFAAERAGSDSFDTTRAMLERMAWAEGGLMPYAEMGSVNDKDYFGGEQVYNQGYSWVRFLAARGGDASLDTLLRHEGDQLLGDFSRALRLTYGAPVSSLEAEWRTGVATRAIAVIAALPWVYEGERYHADGPFTRRPSLSVDGGWIAFTSDGDSDYLSDTLRFGPVTAPAAATESVDDVASRPAWLPDGTGVIVARTRDLPREDRETYDLMRIAVPNGDETWLTSGARVNWPAVHPGGTTIAVAVRGAGSWDLATLSADGVTMHVVTDLPWAWELREFSYAPDGTLWGLLGADGELDLVRIGDAATTVTRLDWPGSQERAPQVGADGRVWFASDRGGSFQVYVHDPRDGSVSLRTGALGGALEAAPGVTATIVTVVHHRQFRLHHIDAATTATLAQPVRDATWRTMSLPRRPAAAATSARRARFRLAPPLVYPEFQYLYGDAAAGAVVVLGDERTEHGLELEGIFGRVIDLDVGYTYTGLPPTISLDVSRYLSNFETALDAADPAATTIPIPFRWDSIRQMTLYDPRDDVLVGLSFTADRFVSEVFGDETELLRRFDGTGLAQWADLEPRPRNDVDLRGTILYGSVSARDSRFAVDSDTSRSVRHARLLADATVARGHGRFAAEAGLTVGHIDRDVSFLDRFFLGGTVFSLRRGELRSFHNLPGYGDFAITGEKLLLARVAARATVWTDIGAAGPLLLDALVIEVAAEAGNAWPHAASWSQVLRHVGDGQPFARGVRPSDDTVPLSPTDARVMGLLGDALLDVKLKAILYDAIPWNSFVRVAHGFQDREFVVDPVTGAGSFTRRIDWSDFPNGLPLRIYVGIGTGF